MKIKIRFVEENRVLYFKRLVVGFRYYLMYRLCIKLEEASTQPTRSRSDEVCRCAIALVMETDIINNVEKARERNVVELSLKDLMTSKSKRNRVIFSFF